jgi:tRNA(Ile)-lysidine synthase
MNPVSPLQQDVLTFIRQRQLIRAGDRVGVAVSGGADSVALLRLLLDLRRDLGIVVAVVHLNHRIRGAAADEDAQFVAQLAAQHGLELHADIADAPAYARAHQLSLEAAGRELRYRFLGRLISAGKLTRVATAHTIDDQAETVLLRVIRGAGTRGLAGIHHERSADPETEDRHAIIRPLLATRRSDLQDYLRAISQPWREDASNRDLAFLRNRVRHELLPLLQEQYNPGIVGVLADSAEAARAEEEYWAGETARASSLVVEAGALDIAQLLALPLAMQRRLIRNMASAHGCQLDFNHVELVLAFAVRTTQSRPATRALQLPGGLQVRRTASRLTFETAKEGTRRQLEVSLDQAPSGGPSTRYEYGFTIPGEIAIQELGKRLRASLIPATPAGRLTAATGSELASGRSFLAGAHQGAAETEGIAAGTANFPA